jgi:hypothetical protein
MRAAAPGARDVLDALPAVAADRRRDAGQQGAPNALTAKDLAILGEVTVATVHHWQRAGWIPRPDGHASGRSWWWLPNVIGVNRRRRPATPRPNPSPQ